MLHRIKSGDDAAAMLKIVGERLVLTSLDHRWATMTTRRCGARYDRGAASLCRRVAPSSLKDVGAPVALQARLPMLAGMGATLLHERDSLDDRDARIRELEAEIAYLRPFAPPRPPDGWVVVKEAAHIARCSEELVYKRRRLSGSWFRPRCDRASGSIRTRCL
jgi:hypothetical protein